MKPENLAAGAAAIATIELLGVLVFVRLAGGSRHPLPAVLGTSFALGLGATAALLFFASLAGLTPEPWFVLPILGLLIADRFIRRPTLGAHGALAARAASAAPERERARQVGLGLLVVVVLALAAAVALLEPVAEWDVIAIWGLKARVLLSYPLSDPTLFLDPTLGYSHLDYPLLWPFALAWVWAWCGEVDLVAVKLLGPATLLAIALALYGLLRPHVGRVPALAAVAAVVSVPMLFAQATRLLADLPLSLFLLVGIAFLDRGLTESEPGALRIAAASGAGLVWCKNEGIALLLALSAVALVAASCSGAERRRKHSTVRPFVFVVLAWLLAAPWLLFRLTLPRGHSSGAGFSVELFWEQRERLLQLVIAVPAYVLAYSDWHLFWPLLAGVLLFRLAAGKKFANWRLFAAIHAPWLAYVFVIVANRFALPELLDTAFDRLLVHFIPAEGLLLGLALGASHADRPRAPDG